jgi:hypothetical protein
LSTPNGGYLQGVRDYNAAVRPGVSREEYKQIMSRHLPVADPAMFERITPVGIDPNGRINVASVLESLEIYRDAGMIPAGELDLSLIDQS